MEEEIKFRVWIDGKPATYEYLDDPTSDEFHYSDILTRVDAFYMDLSKQKERLLLNLMDMVANGQAKRLEAENLVVEKV